MNRKQNSLMKFSRTQRLAQLSEQEIVIEKKKREIQAKIEAQKKKETEEALRKLDSSKETKNNKPGFSRKFSWNRDDYKKNKDKDKSNESEKKDSLKNAFSNDGSFLDQFKKLSKTGLGPNNVDIQTLAMAKKKEDTEKIKNQELNQTETELNWQKKENFMKNEYRDQQTENQQSADNTLSRKPLDSNIQLQLPPPGVVQLVPQHQVQVVSLVQPVVQTPVQIVPPPVQLPSLQPMLQPLNSVPKFTTNEIQLKAISSPSFNEAPQPVPPVHVPHLHSPLENSETIQHQIDGGSSQSDFNQQSVMNQLLNIQPPLPMTPQNIPSPSPIQVQNIPPPPLPPKENNALPKIRTESISMTLKNNPVKKLELIPNPLEADEIPSPPSAGESKFNFLEQREDWKQSSTSQKFEFKAFLEKAASPERKSSRISSALYDEEDDEDQGDHVLEEKHRNLAKMVARYGDEFESSLLQRNENDPDLRFLFEKNSVIYKAYRTLIENYRSQSNVLQQEQREKFEKRSHISDDEDEYKEKKFLKKEKMFMKQESSDSDSGTKDSSVVNRNVKDQTKSENFEKKESDGYQADNEDDVPYYKMPKSNSENDSFLPSQNSLGFKSENSKEMKKESSDESKAEEKPKRKRKSRWGDIASSSTPQTSVGPNLNLQPSKKLPTPKTNLLSQLTRSDPGLIQYAKQTFGSTNLSEEDWKKAEDHYKINLLYQDLVKKRAEIDKLEKAGKFKYEYDSDEDVEGGTWEHKLRQQEMMATQLWAEELTRQAAGKHHIGDFLPPEELKRFMEKYNAVKEGREPDLSDYKEFKLKEDNVGYRLLQKMGWNEGQGLGQDGLGITNPVNKAANRHENQGLGVERPDGLTPGDDEYDAYRKRMMLAYRFRPNPLNNPRRPYY